MQHPTLEKLVGHYGPAKVGVMASHLPAPWMDSHLAIALVRSSLHFLMSYWRLVVKDSYLMRAFSMLKDLWSSMIYPAMALSFGCSFSLGVGASSLRSGITKIVTEGCSSRSGGKIGMIALDSPVPVYGVEIALASGLSVISMVGIIGVVGFSSRSPTGLGSSGASPELTEVLPILYSSPVGTSLLGLYLVLIASIKSVTE